MHIHNAAVRALADEFRTAGLVADEEKAIPSLSWRDRKGKWHDAIMDISVRTRASPISVLLDIVFVDANAKRNATRVLAVALADAEQMKYKKVRPFGFPLRDDAPREVGSLSHSSPPCHCQPGMR